MTLAPASDGFTQKWCQSKPQDSPKYKTVQNKQNIKLRKSRGKNIAIHQLKSQYDQNIKTGPVIVLAIQHVRDKASSDKVLRDS